MFFLLSHTVDNVAFAWFPVNFGWHVAHCTNFDLCLCTGLRSRSRSGSRGRRFLGGVGFLTTLGVGVGFFVRIRLRMSNWIIF